MQFFATCPLFFYENRTILKWKAKRLKTIKTIDFSYFIIKFKIPIHQIKICFYIKCKSEGKSGLLITKFWGKKGGLWSLKTGGLLIQVKVIAITLGKIWRWSLYTGGLLIEVVFRSSLTVFDLYFMVQWFCLISSPEPKAHLSRRLTRWACSIPMVRRLSVVIVVVRRRPHFQTWISLKAVGQSWSNFMCSITGVGERLLKGFGWIGSKLWFPWQQKAPIDL